MLASSTTSLTKQHQASNGRIEREKSSYLTVSNIPVLNKPSVSTITQVHHQVNHHHSHPIIENDLKQRHLSNEKSPCSRNINSNAAAALSAATAAAASALANTRKQQQYAQHVQNLSPIKPSFVK